MSVNHIQELTELTVEPFKRGWFGRLVKGMCEFLNGELMKMPSDDLFGQVVIKDIVID